jgi:hypothetical protein
MRVRNREAMSSSRDEENVGRLIGGGERIWRSRVEDMLTRLNGSQNGSQLRLPTRGMNSKCALSH